MSYSQLFAGRTNEPSVLLAERLIEMAPMDGGRVFFGLSGSDANDTQIKLLWYYNNAIGRPEKKKIISRKRGYHGITIASGRSQAFRHFTKNLIYLARCNACDLSALLFRRLARRNRSTMRSPACRVGTTHTARRRRDHCMPLLRSPFRGLAALLVPPQGVSRHGGAIVGRA
ncbi:MAG: hypothetical protein CM15mP68_6750 [Pseudomonadota bacterium]|nr:MAG: hypothetical protein CM15mP68_6750 [Pseudomonadota bacterium]